MTFEQIIKAAIPDADASLCEHILWGRTPFPMAPLTARSLYEAASRWRRAAANRIQLCDFCDNPARPDDYCCVDCRLALSRRP